MNITHFHDFPKLFLWCKGAADLVAVLHELGQVEQSLRDLGDVLGGEGQLDAADELILLVLAQLGPTRQEGGVEQVSVGKTTGLK